MIGPSHRPLRTTAMHHPGKETPRCLFPVTGNGYGWVTEHKGDKFICRNSGMIPKLKSYKFYLFDTVGVKQRNGQIKVCNFISVARKSVRK